MGLPDRSREAGAGGAGAVHHMPPRRFPPLSVRFKFRTPAGVPPRNAPWAGAGLHRVALVDIDGMILRLTGMRERVLTPEERLAGLVLLARRALDPCPRVRPAKLPSLPAESLLDELGEALDRLDPAGLRLPAIAYVFPFPWWRRGQPVRSPARALALVSRRSGPVFMASAAPRLAGLEDLRAPLAFCLPCPAAVSPRADQSGTDCGGRDSGDSGTSTISPAGPGPGAGAPAAPAPGPAGRAPDPEPDPGQPPRAVQQSGQRSQGQQSEQSGTATRRSTP